MRVVFAFLWAVASCGPALPSGEPVRLVTHVGPCGDRVAEGQLVADPDLGTVFQDTTSTLSVRWPEGFTGVRVAGGEIVVLDPAGSVVATTGKGYLLKGEWMTAATDYGSVPSPRVIAFIACGDRDSVIPR
jgi:hypothetical protein